jgi:hypothetical protein
MKKPMFGKAAKKPEQKEQQPKPQHKEEHHKPEHREEHHKPEHNGDHHRPEHHRGGHGQHRPEHHRGGHGPRHEGPHQKKEHKRHEYDSDSSDDEDTQMFQISIQFGGNGQADEFAFVDQHLDKIFEEFTEDFAVMNNRFDRDFKTAFRNDLKQWNQMG